MIGIKIAHRNKDLNQAKPKDEQFATDLITLPIADKRKFTLILHRGTKYGGSGGQLFPTATIEHGLPYTPLFRGWVEVVDNSTGEKTGRKYNIPVLRTGDIGFYAQSDTRNITIASLITGVTITPSVDLKYDGYMYIFGTRL